MKYSDLATVAGYQDSIGRRTEVNHRVSGRSNAIHPTAPCRRPEDGWVHRHWEGTGPRKGFGLGFFGCCAVAVKTIHV